MSSVPLNNFNEALEGLNELQIKKLQPFLPEIRPASTNNLANSIDIFLQQSTLARIKDFSQILFDLVQTEKKFSLAIAPAVQNHIQILDIQSQTYLLGCLMRASKNGYLPDQSVIKKIETLLTGTEINEIIVECLLQFVMNRYSLQEETLNFCIRISVSRDERHVKLPKCIVQKY